MSRSPSRELPVVGEAHLGLAQLEAILDATSDGILVVTQASGEVCYVNQAAEQLLGRSRGELLGERVAFSVRDGVTAELSIPRPGEALLCEVRVASVDWAGEPAFLGSFRDVTALRGSEGRLRALFDSGFVGIVVADERGTIREANAAFAAMVGHARAELEAGHVGMAEVTAPGWPHASWEELEAVARAGAAPPVETELLHRGGARRRVLLCAAALEPPLYICIVLDVSASDRLVATAAHELRNPIGAIIGFAELMSSEHAGPLTTLQREHLRDIVVSANHLVALVDDLLDLSKVTSGRLIFRPEWCDLQGLVAEVCQVLGGLAQARSVALDVAVDAAVAWVVVDPLRVKQVLYNYLGNAIAFSHVGGRVSVRARGEGEDHVRLEVQDFGVGIAEGDLARLFQPFSQIEGQRRASGKGTGLGLAVTRRIVEAMGGRVEVASTPGQGSTFSAVLPRVTAATEPDARTRGKR